MESTLSNLDLQMPGPKPVSLFSSQVAMETSWQQVNPTWRGIQKAEEWARPEVLEAVKEFRLATRFQLAKSLYRSPDKGKKDLDRAARTGILVPRPGDGERERPPAHAGAAGGKTCWRPVCAQLVGRP